MNQDRHLQVNVADAKKHLSDLLGRVAYGGATVIIMRRGRPMAKLVPASDRSGDSHLADVKGWLADGDPFLKAVDDIVAGRSERAPRIYASRGGLRKR